MSDIENIINLAKNASQGNYDLEKASIGIKGYGFVFRNLFKKGVPSYITGKYSSRVCIFTKFQAIHHLLIPNLHYIGSVKTLLPSIKLGGYYHFFSVWVYVITPTKKQFPIIFYYGKHGYTLGGWDDYLFEKLLNENEDDKELINFKQLINSSPFDLNQEELQNLIENLLRSLKLVPTSEFWGIIEQDSHKTLLAYLNSKDIVESYPQDMANYKIYDKWKKKRVT